jgi:uncharacterized protein (DUF4415 family)
MARLRPAIAPNVLHHVTQRGSRRQPVFLRFDVDMLEWFRQQGRRYQTRMNAVLRACFGTHPRR